MVLGLPHAHLGEMLVAVLGEADDVASLRRTAAAELTAAARPRLWLLAPTVWPLTGAGKVDREALASLADAGRLPRLPGTG